MSDVAAKFRRGGAAGSERARRGLLALTSLEEAFFFWEKSNEGEQPLLTSVHDVFSVRASKLLQDIPYCSEGKNEQKQCSFEGHCFWLRFSHFGVYVVVHRRDTTERRDR